MIHGDDVKRRLTKAMADAWFNDLRRNGVPEQEALKIVEENVKSICDYVLETKEDQTLRKIRIVGSSNSSGGYLPLFDSP